MKVLDTSTQPAPPHPVAGGNDADAHSKEAREGTGAEESLLKHPEHPPKDFHPLKASNETLTRYGFPPRPNRSTHPRQRAIWDRTIGLPMQIPPSPQGPAHPGRPVALIDIGNVFSGATSLEGNSAGVQQSLPGCNSVTASWTIPFPTPPAYARKEDGTYQDGPYAVACCVQLDGQLQAGTITILNVEEGVPQPSGTYAYAVWLTGGDQDPPGLVDNFLLSAGDSVTFTLCAPFSTTFGTALLFNKSTQTPKWVGVSANGGPSLTRTGGSWGVSLGLGDNAVEMFLAIPIPNFNPVFFGDCTVGSPTTELALEGGTLESLSETDTAEESFVVAAPTVIGSEAFYVSTTGPIVG